MKVELGDKVKDKISGFTGIAVSHAKCLTGCDRINVSPDTVDKNGKMCDGYWFDMHQLEVVKKAAVKIADVQEPADKPDRKVGGPPTKASR